MSHFDDPAYDEIRALLAGARVEGPVPEDVAATLDATLADLVADRAGSEAPGTAVVVPLRRRSRSVRFLVAAAAVILVGAGGVGLSDVLRSDDSHTLTSADQPASSSARASTASPEVATGGSGTTGGGTTGTKSVPPPAAAGTTNDASGSFYSAFIGTPGFSRAHFSVQATRYVREVTRLVRDGDLSTAGAPAAAPPPVPQDSTDVTPLDGLARALRDSRPTATCPGPRVTDGSTVVVITFERHRAILVLHPVTNRSRFVVAWSCNGSRLLDFATIRP